MRRSPRASIAAITAAGRRPLPRRRPSSPSRRRRRPFRRRGGAPLTSRARSRRASRGTGLRRSTASTPTAPRISEGAAISDPLRLGPDGGVSMPANRRATLDSSYFCAGPRRRSSPCRLRAGRSRRSSGCAPLPCFRLRENRSKSSTERFHMTSPRAVPSASATRACAFPFPAPRSLLATCSAAQGDPETAGPRHERDDDAVRAPVAGREGGRGEAARRAGPGGRGHQGRWRRKNPRPKPGVRWSGKRDLKRSWQ